MQTPKAHSSRPTLLLAILAAFALRLYQLGAESLWYDETVSVELARKSITGLLAHTAGDIHPPGYYLLLHGWDRLTRPLVFANFPHATPNAGPLEFLYAWPSLCFGILLVVLLFALGRKLYTPQIGLIAAWLATINPYQIWYSQEVRMYTIIAALGLSCLYALLKWVEPPSPKSHRPLIAYALCAAAGLYIHYYLLFGLIALNLIALWFISTKTMRSKWIRNWISAQIATLLLWLPWLPTFWRQATDPPVPPWREPWTLTTFGQALTETINALFIGQSLPQHPSPWIWTLILATIGVALILVSRRNRPQKRIHGPPTWGIVLLYAIGPILLLYTITALGPPIYHVRYLFLFAPLLLLFIARGLLAMWQHNRSILAAILATLLILNGLALHQLWHTPTHQADDHRAAVATLAANWRPNDLILVNAGWTYTALNTYWPTALHNARNALPPQPSTRHRLAPQTQNANEPARGNHPHILYTGTVDGDPNLGWGSPSSDFYAIPQSAAEQALTTLAANHPRIWHYRLYDTNSDPNGAIRAWLDQNRTLLSDQLFAGPASLRVQLYETTASPPQADQSQRPIDIAFGRSLQFDYAQIPAQIPAGEILYIQSSWTPQPDLATLPVDLRFSLRLYRPTSQSPSGDLVTQFDQPALPPTTAWHSRLSAQQMLALPIPIGTQPASYSVELVVYRADTGEPLTLPESERTIHGQRLKIGAIEVQPSTAQFVQTESIATFDYIDLLAAKADRTELAAGDSLQVQLTWRPRASSYTDAYNAIFELRATANDKPAAQTWSGPAGGPAYPSGAWIAERPILERRPLTLDPQLPAGSYRLMLRLERASDGLPINARTGFPIKWRERESIHIATLHVQ